MVALRKAGEKPEKSRFEQQKGKRRKPSGQLLHFYFKRFGDGASWITWYGGLGRGQTKSWLSSQQYSQILSCKYCCLSKDRPAGMIERERFILEDGNHTLHNKHLITRWREVFCRTLKVFIIFWICNSLFLLIIIVIHLLLQYYFLYHFKIKFCHFLLLISGY